MYCKNCGTYNSDASRFCTNCGQIIESLSTCASCRAPLKHDEKFCSMCGTPVAPITPVTPTHLPPLAPLAPAVSAKPVVNKKWRHIQPLPPLAHPVVVKQRKKSKWLILAPVIAILLIISVILGITYLPALMYTVPKEKTYTTNQGKVKKGTEVLTGPDNPVTSAQGITVDFGNFAPEEETVLKISPMQNASDESLGKALASYRITADDQQNSEFTGLVTITIPIDMKDLDDIDVCAAYFDETAQRWIPLPYETDKYGNQVKIYTDHFTDFSLFKLTGVESRFTTAALNMTIIHSFLDNSDYENLYGKLKEGQFPVESDFMTMGLAFMNFTSTAYDAKISMSTIMKNLPLSEVSKMSAVLTKVGFGLVVLKASYEYFILDSTDQAAYTLLMGLTELAIFTVAGAVGGPVAATVAFTIWGVMFVSSIYSSIMTSYDIDTAVKTQQEFVDSQYLYCINERSGNKSGAWYYRYNSPVYTGSGSGWSSYKAGSDADWIKLFQKLYDLNEDDPDAFMNAVIAAVDAYHTLWSRTPANIRGNQWRGDDDPMRFTKYPSLSASDEKTVTALVKEKLRTRLTPIIQEFKRKIHVRMIVEYTFVLEDIAADLNKPVKFTVTSENEDEFYGKYKGSVMRFAVPEDLVKDFSDIDVARWSNRWRFPSLKKDEPLILEATYLGYFLAGSPATLNVFNTSSSLRKNLPDVTVDFKLSRPDTLIIIPDEHPTFDEILGAYPNGTIFYEDVFISELLQRMMDELIRNINEQMEEAGCESEGASSISAEDLIGETIVDTMVISGTHEEAYMHFMSNEDDLEQIVFKYDENTGKLTFTKKHVQGTLVAAYTSDKSGVTIKGLMRYTMPGMIQPLFYIDLRLDFEKPLDK